MKSDLHVHTTFSDGSFSVGEVLDLAKFNKMDCIAITDHDTVAGVKQAVSYGEQIGVLVLRGIEFSCESYLTAHILGYNINCESKELLSVLEDLIKKRFDRSEKIVKKLERYNIFINNANLPIDNIGRSHIAKELVNSGYVQSIEEAFDKYLGENRLAYFPDGRITPEKAVELIKKTGGQAVIAHPINLLRTGKLEKFICELLPVGLGGLEVYYPTHNEKDISDLTFLCEKYGLFKTGGSDFHGIMKGSINNLGATSCELPKELTEKH